MKWLLVLVLLSCCSQVQGDVNWKQLGWNEHVGSKVGILVSVSKQKLFLVHNETILREYPCSTGRNGTGNRANSFCTPLGWHTVQERIGEGMPEGAIFKARQFTQKVWDPHDPREQEQDLVLSRILWLEGQEPGKNKGGDVDTHNRYIYIHGTGQESKIGTPVSYGCIRLKNADVIALFEFTYSGMPVLITE